MTAYFIVGAVCFIAGLAVQHYFSRKTKSLLDEMRAAARAEVGRVTKR